MRKIIGMAMCMVFLSATLASAHTITFGYENAGPGAVTFWYGSYHTHGMGDGPDLEGSLQLEGILGTAFGATVVAFVLDRGTVSNCAGANCTGQPAGLIDGTTNFVDSSYGSGPAAFDDVFSWQGVTFTGLAPGDYQFTYLPIASPTAHWAPWSEAVRTGTVNLSGAIVGGPEVPEPASIILLLTGLAGAVAARRFRKA